MLFSNTLPASTIYHMQSKWGAGAQNKFKYSVASSWTSIRLLYHSIWTSGHTIWWVEKVAPSFLYDARIDILIQRLPRRLDAPVPDVFSDGPPISKSPMQCVPCLKLEGAARARREILLLGSTSTVRAVALNFSSLLYTTVLLRNSASLCAAVLSYSMLQVHVHKNASLFISNSIESESCAALDTVAGAVGAFDTEQSIIVTVPAIHTTSLNKTLPWKWDIFPRFFLNTFTHAQVTDLFSLILIILSRLLKEHGWQRRYQHDCPTCRKSATSISYAIAPNAFPGTSDCTSAPDVPSQLRPYTSSSRPCISASSGRSTLSRPTLVISKQ